MNKTRRQSTLKFNLFSLYAIFARRNKPFARFGVLRKTLMMKRAGKINDPANDCNKLAEKNSDAEKNRQAQPATENLDMEPYSTPKSKDVDNDAQNIARKGQQYADEEHDKASKWEDHSAKKAEKK